MPTEPIQITPEQLQQYAPAIMAGVIVLGLLFCFFGYRIFKVFLSISGAAAGGGGAAYVAWTQWPQMWWPAALAGVVGAAIGAVLMVVLYYVGVFLAGAGFAASVAAVLAGANAEHLHLEALIPAAVVGGVLALIIQKFLIVLSTSFTGAASVAAGAYYFAWGAEEFAGLPGTQAALPSSIPLTGTGGIDFEALLRQGAPVFQNNQHVGMALVGFFVLGVVGMIIQYVFTAKKRKKAAA